MNAVGHIISHKHKGKGMEEKVVVEFINDMKQERKSDKFKDKLVDCLEKCLICRHIRRFAD